MIFGGMPFPSPPEMAGCKVASSNVWTAFRTMPARVFLGSQTLKSGAKQYSRVSSSPRNLEMVTIIFPVDVGRKYFRSYPIRRLEGLSFKRIFGQAGPAAYQDIRMSSARLNWIGQPASWKRPQVGKWESGKVGSSPAHFL